MPYNNVLNTALFASLYNSRFYSLSSLSDLLGDLLQTDFSVVSSRRDAHAALNTFVTSGRRGRNLFAPGVRFPDGFDNHYCSSSDLTFARWLSLMAAVVSHRLGNVAKDIESNGNGTSDRVLLSKEQADQDASKQFAELRILLANFLAGYTNSWSRERFERDIAGEWTAPANAEVPPPV